MSVPKPISMPMARVPPLQSQERAPLLVMGGAHVLGLALSRLANAPATVALHAKGALPEGFFRMNVEDEGEVARVLRQRRPRTLIYGAGVCRVAQCERDPAWAEKIILGGVRNVIRSLPDDARLVYLSSDHVFSGLDGKGAGPPYTETTLRDPITTYGNLRAAAEDLVLERPGAVVVRTGVAIGPSLTGRTGFADWIRYRHRQGLPLTLIEEERRSFALATPLARAIIGVAATGVSGVVHLPGLVQSRREAGQAIAEALRIRPAFLFALRSAQHLANVDLRSEYRSSRLAGCDDVLSVRAELLGAGDIHA